MNVDYRRIFRGTVSGLVFLTAACTEEPGSPEQQIRAMVASGELAAEEKDFSSLRDLVAQDYADEYGRDKSAVESVLRYYLLRNRSIHILSVIRDIQILDSSTARLSVFVAMAGEPVSSLEELEQVRADIFLFKLTLVKQDLWQVQSGTWRRVGLTDLLG